MATPTVVGVSTAVESSGRTSLTITRPTGVVSGDVLVAQVRRTVAGASTQPAGWTLQRTDGRVDLCTKVAGGAEPADYTWSFGSVQRSVGGILAVRGASPGDEIEASAGTTSSAEAPSVTTAVAGCLLVHLYSARTEGTSQPLSWAQDSGVTERWDTQHTDTSVSSGTRAALAAGAQTTRTAILSYAGGTPAYVAQTIAVNPANTAPSAPTLLTPVGGATIDYTAPQTFDWDFADADAGDSQSAYEFRYRVVGAPSWTSTGWVTSTTTARVVAASTFVADDYEWQVRTKDSQGAEGAWSASAFFTAATAPGAPTITAPTNGSTVSSADGSVAWSIPDQDSYQARRVADSAGSPDTATVYYDTGEVVSTSARTADLTFSVNGRWEHVQVRVKDGGLWSAWASVRVQVSYTPPLTPTAELTVDEWIHVHVVNPLDPNLAVDATEGPDGQTVPLSAWPWQVDEDTVTYEDANPYEGVTSIKVVSAGTDPRLRWRMPVEPGLAYATRSRVWISPSTVDRNARVSIAWRDASLTLIGSTVIGTNLLVPTGAWTLLPYLSAVAPSGAAFGDFGAGLTGAAAADIWHLDGFEVWQASDFTSPPTVTHNDIWRRAYGSSDDPERVAAGQPPQAVWKDTHVGHLEAVEYQIEAFGDNGTSALSAWTSDAEAALLAELSFFG